MPGNSSFVFLLLLLPVNASSGAPMSPKVPSLRGIRAGKESHPWGDQRGLKPQPAAEAHKMAARKAFHGAKRRGKMRGRKPSGGGRGKGRGASKRGSRSTHRGNYITGHHRDDDAAHPVSPTEPVPPPRNGRMSPRPQARCVPVQVVRLTKESKSDQYPTCEPQDVGSACGDSAETKICIWATDPPPPDDTEVPGAKPRCVDVDIIELPNKMQCDLYPECELPNMGSACDNPADHNICVWAGVCMPELPEACHQPDIYC